MPYTAICFQGEICAFIQLNCQGNQYDSICRTFCLGAIPAVVVTLFINPIQAIWVAIHNIFTPAI